MQKTTKKTMSKKPSEKQGSKPIPRAEDFPVVISWDDRDHIFVASVPMLQGCMTHGETRAEALTNAQEAAELWLEVAAQDGDFIPNPPKEATGKLLLRLPKDLHARITNTAALEGVSINTWILAAIARADGTDHVPSDEKAFRIGEFVHIGDLTRDQTARAQNLDQLISNLASRLDSSIASESELVSFLRNQSKRAIAKSDSEPEHRA